MAVYGLGLTLQRLPPDFLESGVASAGEAGEAGAGGDGGDGASWEPLLREKRLWKLNRHHNPAVSYLPGWCCDYYLTVALDLHVASFSGLPRTSEWGRPGSEASTTCMCTDPCWPSGEGWAITSLKVIIAGMRTCAMSHSM